MRLRPWLFFGLTLPAILLAPFLWGSLLVVLFLALYRLFKAGPGDAWQVLSPGWPLVLATVAWTLAGWYSFQRCAKAEKSGAPRVD